MATLTGTTIKDTYKSLIKVNDNEELAATLQELTDGLGNGSGISINTSGDLKASGILEFGSLKDTGEDITIVKFVDQADGIASNNNDTTIPTSAAVKDYVDTNVTAQDLDFTGNTGTGAVDLDSQTLNLIGANGVVTTASGQTITIDTSSLDTRLTTAEADIDTNTANIATEISDRTSADSTLQSNIDAEAATRLANDNTLQGNIDTEASTRSSADTTLQANIDTNTANISSNDTDIAGLDTRLTTAEGNITSNDTDIATNAANIATNVTDIATNATNISSNDTDITALQNDKYDKTGGTISGSVTISDDLTVNGTTTTVNTETLSVEDPLIEMANQNAANSVDTGFYAKYSLDAGVTTKYAGLFKDASDSDTFKLFRGLEVEPTTTINTGGTGYALADLDVAGLSASSSTISGDLIVDTNTLYVDSANDFVGIGTTNQTINGEKLRIAGDLFINSLGSATVPSIAIGDTNTGIYSSASGQISITTQGNQRLNIDGNGNIAMDTDTLYVDSFNNRVGIGTTSPLDLVHIKSTTTDARLLLDGSVDSELKFAQSGTVKYSIGHDSGTGNFVIGTANVDTEQRLVIDSSGRVGIGMTPSNYSGYMLQVNGGTQSFMSFGNSATGTGALNGLVIGNDSTGADIYQREEQPLRFHTNSTERMRIDSSGVTSVYNDFVLDYGSPEMYFKTSATHYRWMLAAQENVDAAFEITPSTTVGGTTYSTPVAVFKATGNVGIGTTSPSHNLTINSATGGQLQFQYNTSARLRIEADSGGGSYYAAAGFYHRFFTSGVERLRITSGGEILFGTETASTTHAYFSPASDNRMVLKLGTSTTSGTGVAVFQNPNGTVGSIRTSGTSTAFNTSGSDLRLKKNIEDWNENVLDSFASIQPKEFHFNVQDNNEEKVKGYIAQDNVDKFPEAYPQDEDGFYSYNPSGMVVYLMKAIQELKAEIETLKSQIQ